MKIEELKEHSKKQHYWLVHKDHDSNEVCIKCGNKVFFGFPTEKERLLAYALAGECEAGISGPNPYHRSDHPDAGMAVVDMPFYGDTWISKQPKPDWAEKW